ncbi:hypothetical protein NPIL_241731 [Nephila pilipes]|uniref:Uncharacterized protein n=1 Tax=Nephila pilipes TaxID=299642 RepID=A0A8X6MF39_NEPPI|nr:hypothetical protein NPIL_241731 [Nephila pilipes]
MSIGMLFDKIIANFQSSPHDLNDVLNAEMKTKRYIPISNNTLICDARYKRKLKRRRAQSRGHGEEDKEWQHFSKIERFVKDAAVDGNNARAMWRITRLRFQTPGGVMKEQCSVRREDSLAHGVVAIVDGLDN